MKDGGNGKMNDDGNGIIKDDVDGIMNQEFERKVNKQAGYWRKTCMRNPENLFSSTNRSSKYINLISHL